MGIKSSPKSHGHGIDALQLDVDAAEKQLTGNKEERELINANLERFEDSTKSKKEIDAKAKVVTKETGSGAMASMFGKMWGDLRKFEATAYGKKGHAQLSVLDEDKKDLEAKLKRAKAKLHHAELQKAQANLQKARVAAAAAKSAAAEAAAEERSSRRAAAISEAHEAAAEARKRAANKKMSADETRNALDDNMDTVEPQKKTMSAREARNALDNNMDGLDEAYDATKDDAKKDDAKALGLLQSKVTSTPKIWGSWTDSLTSVSEFVITWPKHVWDYEFVYAFKTNVWKLPPNYWYSHLLSMLVYLGFGVVFAYLYQMAKNHWHPKFFTLEPRPEILPSSEGFTFGIFECCSNMNLCIIGCCCPFLRWADTMDRQGFLSYWNAFLIMFSCFLLHTFTYGVSDIVIVIVGICYRQKLRSRLQIESGTAKSLCTDCLVWAFCQPCAIIQEAHEEVVQHGTLQEEV